MFQLKSNIIIGDFVGLMPHEVKITKSVYAIVNEARLRLPLRARVIKDGKPDKVYKTSELITEGMKASISLGYNERMTKEFEGFVSRINFTSPLEVVCEGYSYQLRKRNYQDTLKNTTLKAILTYLIQGTDIVLDKDNADFPLVKYMCRQQNGIEILKELKEKTFGTLSFRFDDNVLKAQLFPIQGSKNGLVGYKIGYNVIDAGDLKKREAANEDVEINMIGEVKDGTRVKAQTKSGKTVTKANVIKTTASSGTIGEKKHFVTHSITDKPTLQKFSDSKHYTLSFDGYEGKITTFLEPFCLPGYEASINDETYPERNGKYIIDSVEVTYGMSGARRKVGIGHEL